MDEIIKQEIDMNMWELHPDEEISTTRYYATRNKITEILVEQDISNKAFFDKLDKCQFYWYVFGLTHS